MSFGLEDSQYVGQANGLYNGELCGEAMGLTDSEVHVKDGAQTFISVWDTTKAGGVTAANQIRLPLVAGGVYNFVVDWGDGTPSQRIQSFNAPQITHTYVRNGVYTVKITGQINGWQFNNGGDNTKIINIRKWGCLRIDSYGLALTNIFNGCDNLSLTNVTDPLPLTNMQFLFAFFEDSTVTTPTVLSTVNRMNEWDVSAITDFSNMFLNNENFNASIPDWNTGSAVFFSSMFQSAVSFNQPIGNWDTSTLVVANNMFQSATTFNQPLSGWNVSKVTNMQSMFLNAFAFNQDLSNWNPIVTTNFANMFQSTQAFNNGLPFGVPGIWIWNVSAATNTTQMFRGAIAFNQDLSSWDVRKVTTMSGMFSGATSFNSPLSGWVLTSCTATDSMFSNSSFNQDISSWKFGPISTMSNMFSNSPFNQPLSAWNVSNNNIYASMFLNTPFNQNINNWNVLGASSFVAMFQATTAFNQPLSGWNLSASNFTYNMFLGAQAFNQPLSNWDMNNIQDMHIMFSGNPIFNNGLASGVSGTLPWGVGKCTDFSSMFKEATAFNQNLNTWIPSAATNMSNMFNGATTFNGTMTNWNASKVTNFNGMFANTASFNQDVSSFNPILATSMINMFSSATAFNKSIVWNSSACTNMFGMFQNCTNLNSTLSGINTINVTNMSSMFQNASIFNGFIGNWNVSKVTTMSSMFQNALAFNQPLSGWVTSACTAFQGMFSSATTFNQNINSWDVTKSPSLDNMFLNATNFNSPLSGWNTSAATSMVSMFQNAVSFNQPIGNWNMAKVATVSNMFNGASGFNQNIGNWDVRTVANFTNFMFSKTPATFSTTNLDAIYNGWTNKPVRPTQTVQFGSARYTSGSTEGRALLTRPNLGSAISNATNNGSGLIRITSAAHTLVTGNKVIITGVTGTVEANNAWNVNVISTTQVDLQGSTFTNAWISGGNMKTGWGWTVIDGGTTAITSNISCSYTLNSVLTDAAGVCPTATMVGIDYVSGITGNAARFNAPTDVINIANNANLSFSDGVNDLPFSMNMWVYFSGFSTSGNWLFNKRSGVSGGEEWQFIYDTTISALVFQKFSSGNSTPFQGVSTPASPFLLNTWYNITLTDDGSKTTAGMKLYINAVSQTLTDASSGIYLGMTIGTGISRMGQIAFGTGANTAHQGYLEDVSVWKNRVLTQAEITFLYNSGAGRTYPFP